MLEEALKYLKCFVEVSGVPNVLVYRLYLLDANK